MLAVSLSSAFGERADPRVGVPLGVVGVGANKSSGLAPISAVLESIPRTPPERVGCTHLGRAPGVPTLAYPRNHPLDGR